MGRQAGRQRTPLQASGDPSTPLRKAGQNATKGVPANAHNCEPAPKMKKLSKNKKKRFFLHYKKGKYNLINLSLKKKGHDQRY